MSFSSSTKEALLKLKLRQSSQKRAFVMGVTAAVGSISLRRGRGVGIKFKSENYPLIKLLARCAASAYELTSEVSLHDSNTGISKRTAVMYFYGQMVEKLLKDARILSGGNPPELSETDLRVYLRAVFLSCGSVTDPEKSYHLELVCKTEALSQVVNGYLEAFGMAMKSMERSGAVVLYQKDSERISDFLALIGASDSILELENVRAYRDLRNNTNRQCNCEVANIERTAVAASAQLRAIEKLFASELPFELSDSLRETAQARLNNPDATLSELAAILDTSKSGVNHRLKKLSELADELSDKQETNS